MATPLPAPPLSPSSPSRSPVLFVGIAAVLLALVALIVVVALVVSGGDAETVAEVADDAVAAAEDLDVDDGVGLLCDAPSASDREGLEELIAEAQGRAGTEDPEVDYEISDVEGDTEGSFTVTITSDEDGLTDERIEVVVIVEEEDGRSCIAGTEEPE